MSDFILFKLNHRQVEGEVDGWGARCVGLEWMNYWNLQVPITVQIWPGMDDLEVR